MRKRLLPVVELLADLSGRAVRNAEGLAGAACAVAGTVELTGRIGAGLLVAAVFLLVRDATK